MGKRYDRARLLQVKRDWLRDNLQPAERKDGKGRNHWICPLCGAPDVFNPLWDRGSFHCYKCGCSGSVFDVEAKTQGIGIAEAIQAVMSRYEGQGQAVRPQQTIAKPERAEPEASSNGRDVLRWWLTCKGYTAECAGRFKGSEGQAYAEGRRGLTLETCERFGVGYDDKAFQREKETGGTLDRGVSALIFPYNRNRTYYAGRLLQPLGKTRYLKPDKGVAGDEPVYNEGALYGAEICFVCEGIIDALSISQAAARGEAIGACALNGTGHTALVAALKKKPARARLILTLDDDEAGHKGALRVAKALDALGVGYAIWGFGYDGSDDFNALLQRDPSMARAFVNEMTSYARGGVPITSVEYSEFVNARYGGSEAE